MRDYPKHLNTKADYLYVMENFPKEKWEADFKNLLVGLKDWFNLGKIEDGSDGITDDTHKVEVDEQTGDKYQFELKDNPNCLLNRIGFTESEVKGYLGIE